MQIGVIGLGRIGSNVAPLDAERPRRGGLRS